MTNKIRPALLKDAKAFIKVKDMLPLPWNQSSSSQGGFLLGTDLNTYQQYIQMGTCLTAVQNKAVIGFGIAFPNEVLKKSELWKKRHAVHWNNHINITLLENQRIAYLEQLAFLKGHQKTAVILAYQLIKKIFNDGADFVLTTTVKKPVTNEAALPLIRAAGGVKVCNLDEVYAKFGPINSDIHLIAKIEFEARCKKLSIFSLLNHTAH